MSSITAFAPQVTPSGSTTPVKAAAAEGQDTQATGASASAAGGHISGPAGLGGASASGASSDSSSGESDTVKELKKQIAQLQKQLAEELRQLKAVEASKMDREAKTAAVGNLQAQVAQTSASLQTAMNALTRTLLAENGNTSGSMLNTTA